MKLVPLFVVALAIAAPVRAQHVHDQGAPPAPQRGGGPQTPPIEVPWNDAIPAGTAEHAARALKESPRHGEWVDIKMADGTALKSWVVYPEKATKTGVVIVIHDIRGMADITRAVGDQLAQDGFIAIVPDFLSGKGPNGGGTRVARYGRRPGDSGVDAGRREGTSERGHGIRQEAAGVERQDGRRRILLGRRAQLRLMRRRSPG